MNNSLAIRCLRIFLVAMASAGWTGASPVERLETMPVETLWRAENSSVVNGNIDGEPVIVWQLETGQTAKLAVKPETPIFQRLRYFDRLEFEFRIVGGSVDVFELLSKGHVSGPRQYKVHQWPIAVATTGQNTWHTRQLDLARPAWFPWDDPDGAPPHFSFAALALDPGTRIEIRRLRLMPAPLIVKPFFEIPITWPMRADGADGSATYTLKVPVLNGSGMPATIRANLVSKHEKFDVSLSPSKATAKNGETVVFTASAKLTAANIAATPELYSEVIRVEFSPDSDVVSTFEMPVTRPLSARLNRQFVIPVTDVEVLREKAASADTSVREALNTPAILAAADRFLAIRLDQIPRLRPSVANDFPTVPGSQPPRAFAIGEVMPEVRDVQSGTREIGTPAADLTWKEYLGYTGKATEQLGLAYALTGNEKYAAKAVELMEVYARQYAFLDWGSRHEVPWNTGPAILVASRTASNSSYGANWFFRWHMRMLGLIGASASLTPESRRRIYDGFVLPYATELAKFPGGISNMTDITNHNLLALGLVFDDANLVRWALQTDSGLLRRLGDIDPEGFSTEGRPINYHFAAMSEYLPAISFLANSGLKTDIPKERLLEAVRMPYRRATLWGYVPNTGDCGRGFRVGNTALADELISIFPSEDWLLDIGLNTTPSIKLRRLLAGRAVEPQGYRKLLETKPRLFREAGLAILRTGETPETQIMTTLDYGRNTMHAHLDRNQITLAAFGKIFTHGPGTLYNAGSGDITLVGDKQLQSFCGSGSLGQNIILVDQMNQRPSAGKLLAWSDGPGFQFAVSRVDGIAPGVSHTRALILRNEILVLIDHVESADEHSYDFVYHNFGTLEALPGWTSSPASQPLGKTANYENITNLHRLIGMGPLALRWDLSDQVRPDSKEPETSGPWLALWQLPVASAEIFTGITGLNNPNTARMPDAAPSLFTRVGGKSATFVTVLEPYRSTPRVTGIEQLGGQLTVKAGGQSFTLQLREWIDPKPKP